MNEKYDRNLQIYKEKEAGTTFRALADKYKLSREVKNKYTLYHIL